MRKVAAIKSWVEDFDHITNLVEDLELMPDFVREGVMSDEEMEEAYTAALEHIEELELKNMLHS